MRIAFSFLSAMAIRERFIFLLLMLLPSFGTSGCDSFQYARSWMKIRITDRQSGAPLDNARVTVAFRNAETPNDQFADEPFNVQPTEPDGTTWIPFVLLARDADAGLLITVRLDNTEDEIEVRFSTGSVGNGERSTVVVLSVDAAPPPPPTLELAMEEDAPVVNIRGYIYSVNVCSLASGMRVWTLQPGNEDHSNGIPFVDDVLTIGEIPPDYFSSVCAEELIDGTPIPVPLDCPSQVIASRSEASGFVAFAYYPGVELHGKLVISEIFDLEVEPTPCLP